MPATALQARIVSTLQHIFREILAHLGTAPRLWSSLLLFSQPSLPPLDPSRDTGAENTQ